MNSKRFYIINGKYNASCEPRFLCMKRGGDFDYYWGRDMRDAVRYLSTARVPDINIDLIGSVWVDDSLKVIDLVTTV